jgi:hypothetical protein
MKLTGFSKSTILKAIKNLESAGYIEVERQDREKSNYTVPERDKRVPPQKIGWSKNKTRAGLKNRPAGLKTRPGAGLKNRPNPLKEDPLRDPLKENHCPTQGLDGLGIDRNLKTEKTDGFAIQAAHQERRQEKKEKQEAPLPTAESLLLGEPPEAAIWPPRSVIPMAPSIVPSSPAGSSWLSGIDHAKILRQLESSNDAPPEISDAA